MNDPVIEVSQLSKHYTIGGPERASNMRELLTRSLKPWQWFNASSEAPKKTFWALKNISFEVQRGEVVGIIGSNGAGKSTLLKLLSRITEPAIGKIRLKGKVGSLLEVGTGFHPELTGRENLYLSGAILGMSKADVRQRFDAIVSFAGVEQFIDTPVKWYSSGMYLRLAFSVAAHLEPEILIVDEVLAVGDSEFQKKCLGRMNEVSRSGRTVLFVSHNMAAIELLCSKALLLSQGQLKAIGEARAVVRDYEQSRGSQKTFWHLEQDGQGWQGWGTLEKTSIVSVSVKDPENTCANIFETAHKTEVCIVFYAAEVHSDITVGFDLKLGNGITLLQSSPSDSKEQDWLVVKKGYNAFTCTIPPGILSEGCYSVSPWITRHGKEWLCKLDDVCQFDTRVNHGVSPLWANSNNNARPGLICPILRWENTSESLR